MRLAILSLLSLTLPYTLANPIHHSTSPDIDPPQDLQTRDILFPRQNANGEDDDESGRRCVGSEDGSNFNAYACIYVQRDRNSRQRIRVRIGVKNPSNNDPVYGFYAVYFREGNNEDSHQDSEKLIVDESGHSAKKDWRIWDEDKNVRKVRVHVCIQKNNAKDSCRGADLLNRDFRVRNFDGGAGNN
ncbi:hypothetical protein HII31_01412 [Pseudocercospora fuligena]|uniref:Uncharacterized protein n=1 Tax=Pseudocercospora fuligena TaxID=685502 RepID=A0A8H6RUR2_9PEZI|nr:hypothetical protein HII31_01412 [Pseudocercospora fuligena]